MVRRADDHDMSAGATDLGASQHQLDVVRLGVLSPELEAVVRAHTEARLITVQALVDAGLHGSVEMVHDRPPVRRTTNLSLVK
jgi:hypothetical protein